MLAQSHEKNILRVLPALPKAWENGWVTGLKARGGLELDIYWEDNSLRKMVIHSEYNSDFDIIYNSNRVPLSVKKGIPFNFEPK